MEQTIKAVLDGKVISINVNEDNFKIVKLKLLSERKKIVGKLRGYKSAGLIGSIFYPRNKRMQEHLNNLVKTKKTIKKSVETINKLFR